MTTGSDRPTTVAVVPPGSPPVVVVSLRPGTADLAVLDRLLRLRLAARRCGWGVTLPEVSAPLRAVLELAGAATLLGVQPGGQPEAPEALGVEEVVEPGDGGL